MAPYTLPADDVLVAPFEAFAKLSSRPAQALLTATAALYAAGRGSRAQIADQVREARRSIECLCEPVQNSNAGSARQRWDCLAKRLDIWRHVAEARAYTPAEIDEVQSRLINARNIGTHGADAALLDLGWTAGDRPLRYGLAAATDLSLAALSRDLNPMLFAIGEALRGAWKEMRVADFDEGAFEMLCPLRLTRDSRSVQVRERRLVVTGLVTSAFADPANRVEPKMLVRVRPNRFD